MIDFRGKTAVITGGSAGIGRSLALALAKQGMNIVVAATNRQRLESVVDEVRKIGVRSTAILCDVSQQAQVEALAEQAFAEYGEVNLLCNNAGVTTIGPFLDHTSSDWAWVYGVVLMGVVYGIQAFYPRMVRQGGGQIMNTHSQAGLVPDYNLNHGPYTSAKAGVMALSVALRPEAAEHGIGVSVLIPYAVRTDILLSERSRPPVYGGPREPIVRLPTIRPGAPAPAPGPFMLEPDEVARIAIEGLKDDRPFITTHKAMRPISADYFERILSAYDV
jgi:NAD(P)-dependent dehydrogenase (short-subunit alcohol dehydrogenase family)